MARLTVNNILDIEALSPADLLTILDTAEQLKPLIGHQHKFNPLLRGKTVLTLFYEPSTRTRCSFELASKYLGAHHLAISKQGSSFLKGETLKDTLGNLEAMGVDLVVMRHPAAGAAHYLARHTHIPVINAGDGMHAHPTQALLDLLSIRQYKPNLKDITVTIVGDIRHSRVARSNIVALNKVGAQVRLVAPSTFLPPQIERLGVAVYSDLTKAIAGADVIMALRIQKERQLSGYIPSLSEYSRLYGLTLERLKEAKPDVMIMHPGPINRGVELTSQVADGPKSVILDQIPNGVAIRMALLTLLLGGSNHEQYSH